MVERGWRRYALIALGNVLISFAYAFITVPKGIVNGGTTSFSMVISKLTGVPVPMLTNSITVLLFALCWIFLGRGYASGAVFSAVSYMAFFTSFSALGWQLPTGFYVSVPLAALVIAVGYALCIKAKSTALGFDTLALIAHSRRPTLNIALTMGCINALVLLSGWATYGLRSVLAGIVFTALQTWTLNQLLKLLGVQRSREQVTCDKDPDPSLRVEPTSS